MAMRITTKMMQNTSLRNLNINKYRQEKLTNQLATGKKISRPSDDPVIAIRALKLNASLDKIDQYYEKNAADAESWLKLTDSAISTVNEILSTDVRSNINQACNSYMNADDRKKIIEHLTNAVEEIYSTGNASSAGRSIFTGYRTDMSLTMRTDKKQLNTITEQLTNAAIQKKIFVTTGDLKSINEGNFMDKETTEYDVKTYDIYRIRLAYGDVDIEAVKDANGQPVLDADGKQVYKSNIDLGFMTKAQVTDDNRVKLETGSVTAYVNIDTTKVPVQAVFTDALGTVLQDGAGNDLKLEPGDTMTGPNGETYSYGKDGKITIQNSKTKPEETVTIGSSITKGEDGKSVVKFDEKYKTSLKVDNIYPTGTDDDAYLSVTGEDNADKITYIADTGELLLGENVQKRLAGLSSDTELRVTYDKTNWKENDLDPVHYFYTERTQKDASGKEKVVNYNEKFLEDPTASGKQIIEYDIGNNQSLRVNTTADEVFTHDMGRDMLDEYGSLEESLNTVEKMMKSEKYDEGSDEYKQLELQKKALGEAMTRVGDKINKRCKDLLDDCDGYLDKAQLAGTDCGARGSRLKLIQNRLNAQQTDFGELVSTNEDADYTDLVIQLKSVEMTYNAALSSISYVMQTSLLDFIR